MPELPDFLQLSEPDREREKNRQDKLRQEFHSRAQQTGPELEMSRAIVIEPDLRQALKQKPGDEEKASLLNRLADNLSQQGRFVEASRRAIDADIKAFNKKAAKAVFDNQECSCTGPIETVDGRQIRLPKYRVIKEVYSIKLGQFGFLVECQRPECGNWCFVGSNPLPEHTGKPVSDLERLKP